MKIITYILIFIILSSLTFSVYFISNGLRDYFVEEFSKPILNIVCNYIVGEISFDEEFEFKIIKKLNIPKKIFKYRYVIYGKNNTLVCEIPGIYSVKIYIGKRIRGEIVSTLENIVIIRNDEIELISY